MSGCDFLSLWPSIRRFEAKMKEPEPYRDADIWFSETEEEEERDMSISSRCFADIELLGLVSPMF